MTPHWYCWLGVAACLLGPVLYADWHWRKLRRELADVLGTDW